MKAPTLLAVAALAISTTPPQHARVAPARERRLDRLVALANLDAAVHYFHPRVALHASSWDSAYASSAFRIADARDSITRDRAVDALLSSTGDPDTRRIERTPHAWTTRWLSDTVLVVSSRASVRSDPALASDIANAAVVILDLRQLSRVDAADSLASTLFVGAIEAPLQRSLEYHGLPPASGTTTGGYRVEWRRRAGETLRGTAERAHHVAFLVDSTTVLPPVALALRRQGRAAIVGERITRVAVSATIYSVALDERTAVQVRVAERVGLAAGLRVDTTAATHSDAIRVAIALAARAVGPMPLDPADNRTVLPARPRADASWNAAFPAIGYRILAASRLWSAIRLFFPYKDLLTNDWNVAFRAALASVEHAGNALEFGEALAEFSTSAQDSHVNVASAALARGLFGAFRAPALTQFVDDKLVVTRLADSSAAHAGLRVGDEIVRVDGESVWARSRRLGRYIAASTPQALQARLESIILNGLEQVPVQLDIRDARGAERRLLVPRGDPTAFMSPEQRTGDIIQMLRDNIGYVDLDRLTPAMVDGMFTKLAGATAIVFDMRGYPKATAWAIAPRLAPPGATTPAALFVTPVVASPDPARDTISTFTQFLPPSDGITRYVGRTVLLLDERTMSQAEHTALFFRAANGTAFVGSPTAGADGDITNLLLPGRIGVTFSGQQVRWPDGRRLQRFGVQPDIVVRPTLAGIRAHRDEVLDAAIAHIVRDGGHAP